jgi:hypothetical protein
MALSWLYTEVMVVISEPWVKDGEAAKAAIDRIPHLAVLSPQLQKAHAALFEVKAKESPNLRDLSQRENKADARHDAYVKGMYCTLTTLAPISSAPQELLDLRDKLYPQGLEHIKMSYRAEVGHAAFIAAQMDEAWQARLKAVTLHKATLFDLYNEWQAAAQLLGQLEDERARVSGANPTVAGEVSAARNRWIRMAKALMANAKIAEVDAATDTLLFSALRLAERAAENRVRGHAEPAPAPAPAPEPAPKG